MAYLLPMRLDPRVSFLNLRKKKRYCVPAWVSVLIHYLSYYWGRECSSRGALSHGSIA